MSKVTFSDKSLAILALETEAQRRQLQIEEDIVTALDLTARIDDLKAQLAPVAQRLRDNTEQKNWCKNFISRLRNENTFNF